MEQELITYANGIAVVHTACKTTRFIKTVMVVADCLNRIKKPIKGTDMVELDYCDVIFQIAKLNTDQGDYFTVLGDIVVDSERNKLMRVYETNNYSKSNESSFAAFKERYTDVLNDAILKLT